jgi:hypothetical protein
MKVRIVKNPSGRFNLAYDIGEEINLPDSKAMDMIEDGYAILVVKEKQQNATDKRIAVESR